MEWKKIGQIFKHTITCSWKNNSALTPTPILLDDTTIRIYAGFRDSEGISRIGYVDVDAKNPKNIKKVSENPALDIGRAGCFDDNGVILGDVIRYQNRLRMYYIGFQLVKKAKFLAFTGLAESHDNGETFVRLSEVPVLDRAHGATTIGAIHTAFFDEGKWKIWYAAGNHWQSINNNLYPKYNIWYKESLDGIVFPNPGILCIDVGYNEYRIGRPSVYKKNNTYYMFYTKGSPDGKEYFPGFATSHDGIEWIRKDEESGFSLSDEGFDSIHLCYPRLIHAHDKTWCFYNGNNMGFDGFGLLELLKW